MVRARRDCVCRSYIQPVANLDNYSNKSTFFDHLHFLVTVPFKKYCEVKVGVTSQCMVKPRNLNDQYFGNLALKINLKVSLLTIPNDQHVTHQHVNLGLCCKSRFQCRSLAYCVLWLISLCIHLEKYTVITRLVYHYHRWEV